MTNTNRGHLKIVGVDHHPRHFEFVADSRLFDRIVIREGQTLEFKVTDLPETAAAKLKIEPNPKIGQITAQFSAAWKVDQAKPADEPATRGTGFGDEIKDKKQTVKRHIGNVRATIIVRYER